MNTHPQNMTHWTERVDLAVAFRWIARLNMHEAVANHISLAINDDGTQFLMNPNQMGVVAWIVCRLERALPKTEFRRCVRTVAGQVWSSG